MEKFGIQRNLQGMSYKIMRLISFIVILYHLNGAFFGAPEVLKFHATHVAMFLSIIFMTYSFRKLNLESYIPWYDYILIAMSWVPILYIFTNYNYFVNRYPYIDSLRILDYLMAIIMAILIIEACRRSLGYPLPILLAFFIIHALFGQYFPFFLRQSPISLERLIDHLFMIPNGMWGSITGISATYVLMFVLLGALLEEAKGGELFINLAISLSGKSKGGPAKAAIISSALFGTISGSAVANVYATGTFTIPLMIKTGFTRVFAGAVEAVASSCGQLMPPVMGSAVFLMANFTQIPYISIARSAILPAFLYILAIYIMVHLEAVKNNLPSLSSELISKSRKYIKPYLHMSLALVVLLYLLIKRYTPFYAAFMGVISTFLLSQIRADTRIDIPGLINSFERAARRVAPIASALFVAGMVVGTIELSGLGLRFTSIILRISGGNLLVTLILIMFSCIMLGMGLPTSASYLIVAIFAAPALIELGVPPLVGHLFIFYFAIVAAITPPVAMAAYAAASIADASMSQTGWKALRLGLAIYLIPYAMVYNNILIDIGINLQSLRVIFTASMGILALAVFVQGFLFTYTSIWERVLSVFSAVLLVWASLSTDVIGILFLLVVFISQFIKLKRLLKKQQFKKHL